MTNLLCLFKFYRVETIQLLWVWCNFHVRAWRTATRLSWLPWWGWVPYPLVCWRSDTVLIWSTARWVNESHDLAWWACVWMIASRSWLTSRCCAANDKWMVELINITDHIIDIWSQCVCLSLVYSVVLDTVDFIHDDGKCVFRTCKEESSRVVFQMVCTHRERERWKEGERVCFVCVWERERERER